MKKLISFSLWGNSKLYCQGAIDNIECAKKYYPDWICRFYVAANCPALPYLEKMDCETIICPVVAKTVDRSQAVKDWHWQLDNINMMWRFLAISDLDVERVIFRDTDSRLSAREADAVKEWVDSDMIAHRMHEIKEHWNAQIMGGMWGIKGGVISHIDSLMSYYIKNYTNIRKEPWIFVDLWFIMDILWPLIRHDCMGHGFGHIKQFKVDGPMVGCNEHQEWRYEIFQ